MSTSSHLHQPVKTVNGLELHYIGDIAVIVMGCGENRINTQFIRDFSELLDDVQRNTSCKGVITTGKGKYFCNGLDQKWMATLSHGQLDEFFSKLSDFTMRLVLFPLPTVAAINGHAFAGGAFIAFAHDLRVQNQDRGWLCVYEVWIGLRLQQSGISLVRTKTGGGRSFTDAVVLGKRFTGPKSVAGGLAHAAVPESLLLAESVHLLKSFNGKSGYPRESLQRMKADVYREVVEFNEAEKSQTSVNVKALKPKL